MRVAPRQFAQLKVLPLDNGMGQRADECAARLALGLYRSLLRALSLGRAREQRQRHTRVRGEGGRLINPRTGKLVNEGRITALSDARSMSPQGLADWLASWVK